MYANLEEHKKWITRSMQNIESKKTYGLIEIVKIGVLGKRNETVVSCILKDRLDKDILCAQIIKGVNKYGTRYAIKGKNIIKYLEKTKCKKAKVKRLLKRQNNK